MNRPCAAVRRVVIGLLAAFACTVHAAPRTFPLQHPGSRPPEALRITDYPQACDAIAWVIANKLGLPAPRGMVEIHATRASFEQAMVRYLKVTPDAARSAAKVAKSAVGSHVLLVNEPAIAGESWPKRVELLAHEAAHLVELTLARRSGLSQPQWLIEGFAEWVAFNVTDALGLEDLDGARQRMATKLRELRHGNALPRLMGLVTFTEWVEARKRYGFDATYSLAFFVTDFLIERHSPAAAAEFFRRFAQSDDYAAHFKAAFGEDIGAFERALDAHLDRMLR